MLDAKTGSHDVRVDLARLVVANQAESPPLQEPLTRVNNPMAAGDVPDHQERTLTRRTRNIWWVATFRTRTW